MAEGERRREGSQVCSGDAVTPAYVYIYVSVLMCVCLRGKKSVYLVCRQVSVSLYMCVCAGAKGQDNRDGAKGEGHNALGEGDQICDPRW